jgi:hypothetical protein
MASYPALKVTLLGETLRNMTPFREIGADPACGTPSVSLLVAHRPPADPQRMKQQDQRLSHPHRDVGHASGRRRPGRLSLCDAFEALRALGCVQICTFCILPCSDGLDAPRARRNDYTSRRYLSSENMNYIDRAGRPFVTVLPRSCSEDGKFRHNQWIQTHNLNWECVWDRPNSTHRQSVAPRSGRLLLSLICSPHLRRPTRQSRQRP